MVSRIVLLLALTTAAAFAASEENRNEEFDVSPGGNLVVDVAFGEVEVAAGPDNKVSIQAHRKIETDDEAKEKQYLAEVPIQISKDGNTVTVRARRTDKESWSWNCSGHTTMDARYTVRVPKKFNLDLKSGGGGISANDVEGTTRVSTGGGKLRLAQLRGPVEAKTSGGGIRLNACEGQLLVSTSGGEIKAEGGSGTLEGKTSGGSVVVRDFNGDTSVKTSGGSLTLENVRGRLTGKTSGGSITAALVSPVTGDIELASSAGSISVAVPTDAAFQVDASASVGAVSTDLPFIPTHVERDELRGALNGGGKSVILRASAGSISIRSAASKTAMH
ncbi:MAG TPA: DUF4097 family beta strand repeat-containing protein [Chthoniobacterales bacterium]|nr:DUF4097 family beta strand repeat-containing protein [Chthoniobacterales bacterium]